MDHSFVAVRIYSVSLKITMQHILLRMQNETKIATQRLELHLLYGIERMCAGLCTALDHLMANFTGIDELIVLQVLVKLS